MKKDVIPELINLNNTKQFRIIPSVLPTINFFEDLVNADEMEALWEVESLTNERLRQEAGDIYLVNRIDRVSGAGASVVMAAYTHISKPSRFTDGSFGIYYASLSLETAIKETVYNREIFLKSTNEDPCEITMRTYEGTIIKPLHDLRDPRYKKYHHPDEYTESQIFGKHARDLNSWGLIYNSVRHSGGECIAALRPPAISIPKPTSHLRYYWNGTKITKVYDTKLIYNV